MKKFFTLALSILILSFSPSAAFAADYQGASSWAVPELNRAAQYGLITDRIKSNMNQPVTREEFAEIAVKLYEISTDSEAPVYGQSIFADTSNQAVEKAYILGIVSGTNETQHLFSPNAPISREQVAAMLFRTYEAIGYTPVSSGSVSQFSDRDQISAYAMEAVAYMSSQGFIMGSGGNFDPKGTCSREMAVIISTRVYEKAPIIEAEAQAAQEEEYVKLDEEAKKQNPSELPDSLPPGAIATMVPLLPDAYVFYVDEWDGGDGGVCYTTDYSISDIVKFYTDITIYQNGKSTKVVDEQNGGKTIEVLTNNRHILIYVSSNDGKDFPKKCSVMIDVFWYMPV